MKYQADGVVTAAFFAITSHCLDHLGPDIVAVKTPAMGADPFDGTDDPRVQAFSLHRTAEYTGGDPDSTLLLLDYSICKEQMG